MVNLPWFVTPYHRATLAALEDIANRPSLWVLKIRKEIKQ